MFFSGGVEFRKMVDNEKKFADRMGVWKEVYGVCYDTAKVMLENRFKKRGRLFFFGN
ncbi:MAG: hypothetical protein LBS15_02320 [Endomicrobium sp.]|nr:hypothetical protein [Endomicrobium sp.]